jgi:ATP-dependent Lhr-like helicase
MPLPSFHLAIQRWFTERLGQPTAPQRKGWPLIRAGRHVLIATPTGYGKTLAAFLTAIDALLMPGAERCTSVLYISPLRTLANDVQWWTCLGATHSTIATS